MHKCARWSATARFFVRSVWCNVKSGGGQDNTRSNGVSRASVDGAIVRVRQCRCLFVPIRLVFDHVATKHGQDGPVESFGLAICLCVICGGKLVGRVQQLVHSLKELGIKPLPIVAPFVVGGAVLKHSVLYKGDLDHVRVHSSYRHYLGERLEAVHDRQ